MVGKNTHIFDLFLDELKEFFIITTKKNVELLHFNFIFLHNEDEQIRKLINNVINKLIETDIVYYSIIIPNKINNQIKLDFIIGVNNKKKTKLFKKLQTLQLNYISVMTVDTALKCVDFLFSNRYDIDHYLLKPSVKDTINFKVILYNDKFKKDFAEVCDAA